MADLNVSLIISAIDRATAPLRNVQRAMAGVRASIPSGPLKRLGTTAKTSLMPIVGSAAEAGKAFSSASDQVGKLAKRVGVLGGLGGYLFKSQFVDTASQFEMFNAQLESLQGSSEKARQAMSWVTEFATKTPTDVAGVMDAFVRMRAFGLDPMDGSMQAIVDQTSKLGFSQDKMVGIVTALGQAWTKQKLQGEEALQLIERGVPVWDLLASATGHSAVALQEMSSKGRLGRKEISLLIAEMGKQSAGAAEKQMNTYAGMVSNLGDAWTQFKLTVMGAGVFDFIKDGLRGAIEWVDRMTKSGRLDQWAKDAADAMKGAWNIAKQLGRWIRDDLVPGVSSLVQAIGGWRNALIAVGVIMSAKTIVSVGQLGIAVARLGVKIVTTLAPAIMKAIPSLLSLASATWATVAPAIAAAAPYLAVAAAIGAVTLAVRQLIKYWDQLDFGEAFKGISAAFSEDGVLSTLGQMLDPRALLGSIRDDLGFGGDREPIGPEKASASSRAEVGGQIGIRVDGPARVTSMQSSGPVALDLDTGFSMVTP